ncbi:MAG TPA: hypothetical protein VKY22_29550 [Bradyrhizobium sp.]|nr:hypothetical protein [Bradyrhizobium sp.]
MRRLIAIAIAALVFGALSGVAAYQKVRPQSAVSDDRRWQEIAWPYPRDGWPAGRAFRCDGCAEPIELYVRPKIGFCNCDTGVADDDEVDRVADLDLISERFAPLAPGRVIRVADMSGRARAYDLDMQGGIRHAAVGIAVSHRCDLLVAVVQGRAHADELQREAVEFLTTTGMQHWMTAALGGG